MALIFDKFDASRPNVFVRTTRERPCTRLTDTCTLQRYQKRVPTKPFTGWMIGGCMTRIAPLQTVATGKNRPRADAACALTPSYIHWCGRTLKMDRVHPMHAQTRHTHDVPAWEDSVGANTPNVNATRKLSSPFPEKVAW